MVNWKQGKGSRLCWTQRRHLRTRFPTEFERGDAAGRAAEAHPRKALLQSLNEGNLLNSLQDFNFGFELNENLNPKSGERPAELQLWTTVQPAAGQGDVAVRPAEPHLRLMLNQRLDQVAVPRCRQRLTAGGDSTRAETGACYSRVCGRCRTRWRMPATSYYRSPSPQVSATSAFATPSLISSDVKINIPAQATIRSMNGLGSGRWSPSYKPGVNEAYLEGIVVWVPGRSG